MELFRDDERINPVMFRVAMKGFKLLSTSHIQRKCILIKGTNWGLMKRSEINDDDSDTSDDELQDENGEDGETSASEAQDTVAKVYNRSGSIYCCVRFNEYFRLDKAERNHAAKCKVTKNSRLFLDRAVLCSRRCMYDHTINVHTKASENENRKHSCG